MTHALETYVTKPRTAISMAFSFESWQLLSLGFEDVIKFPDDLEARAEMQLGAMMAGMAIEASMLGAAHALANPLTSRFKVPHGQAVGLMMPHVIRFNGRDSSLDFDYRRLYEVIADRTLESISSPTHQLADWFKKQLVIAELKTRLADFGIPRDALHGLSLEAAKQWTATFNPVEVDAADLLRIYEEAY
jgi:alcohol dehydrogenase